MRRVGVSLLAVVAIIAMAASEASAQPKVTISGFMDNVSSWTRNLSIEDLNPARDSDDEWYARTRARPDIIAEVGTTKFVLGLEIDAAWGQTGATDGSFGAGGPQRFGQSAGYDQNTDVAGIIELKWAYTEFRVPLLPFATVMRVGAQPFAAMYKLGVLATGDFAGVHLTSQVTPIVKTNFTYVQIEEESTGPRDGFVRGDDFALIASVEVTPFKGLDIRPIYSYAHLEGTTNGNIRRGRGGLGTGAPTVAQAGICVNAAGAESLLNSGTCATGTRTLLARVGAANGYADRDVEERHTLGVDARWRFGPFSLDPTVMYQFGSRQFSVLNPPLGAAFATSLEQTRSAWYVDLRAGWQAGPLLLEAIGIYTTGNKAQDRIDRGADLKHFETISTDRGNFATWCEITCSNIDYSNRFRAQAANLDTGHTLGYDKYGIMRVGLRANYALTPAFTVRAMGSASWTAEEVDTSSTIAAGTALTPGDARGDSRYYGSELNLGFQWRFAPNVALDVVGSYFFTGSALSAHTITGTNGVARDGRDPEDVQVVSTRIRYSF